MKANTKKPNKWLMIFGVIFILAGIILAISFESINQKEQALAAISLKYEEIKSDAVFVFNFLPTVEKYSVDVIENTNGYDLNITMNDLSDGKKFKEWCVLNGRNFMSIFKWIFPEIDQNKINYKFTFIGTSETYTAVNTDYDWYLDSINATKLILMNSEIPLPSPSYEQCRKSFYDQEIYNIITAVEGSVHPVAVDVIANGDGFDVNITIIDEDYDKITNCALNGINFLERTKTLHPDIDKKIIHYNISYMSGSNITYTSEYTNGTDESKYTIRLAIKDGDTVLPAKTRMQYTKETLIYDPKDTMIMSGTSFQVLVDDNGIYSVQPKTEADKIRDPDSTLMKYEQEFVSQYFTLKKVQMTIEAESATTKNSNIKITFNNTSDKIYYYLSIYCEFVDSNGNVIYQNYSFRTDIGNEETYEIEISNKYGINEQDPVSFKITDVSLNWITGSKYIIFD